MITIQNLSKSFGKLQVLKDVSLACHAGECIALIGHNGCGKTTLIKSILGMVIPTAGKIFFQEKPIGKDVAYRNHIGYMPQIGRYPANMTIGQMIEMMKSLRKKVGKAHLDEELIEAFDLPALFSKRMSTLSGGTIQKVSAVLAFLFNPDVLILDEPTAGLDPLASEVLKKKIIKEKEKGKLILITSHILSELEDLVTQVIFMQEGEVRFHQNLETLKEITEENTLAKAISHILKKNEKRLCAMV